MPSCPWPPPGCWPCFSSPYPVSPPPPRLLEASTPSLTATVHIADRSVDLAIENHTGNWWFRIESWGSCTAVSGTSINGIKGYKSGTYDVWAYSNSNCGTQIASTTFTIPNPPSLTATVNSNRSVDLTLTNGTSPWYFRIGGGSCTTVSGTTVSGIKGYAPGYYEAVAFATAGCTDALADTYFTIPDPPYPNASLATTVTSGPAANLNLSNGPSNWWFRINSWGSCTAVTGSNTVDNIRGYAPGTHSVNAYSDDGCHTKIASSSFTIPALAATVNDDWSVDLTLTGWPDNWWFKIGWWGDCTAASGATVSNIRGYKSGWYVVGVYPASGCAAGSHIATDSFTIPTATLTATVNNDRSVDLNLSNGPSNWWFRINSWGTCTAAPGTTVSNIQGYQPGTHAVAAYSDNGCKYHVAATTFTLYSLSASSVTQTSATLTLAGHTGNWYLKETSPSTGTCSSAISGGTHSLSSLTGGTTYTYKAYSDSACSTEIASETFTTTAIDYDADDDGLIEITTLAQLNAVRWDLDGNGQVTGSNQTDYRSAFPAAVSYTGATALGCPSAGCQGYELANDLDFDTNGNDSADSGDTYWNGGAGWSPIGGWSDYFTGTFEGNSNKLSNLHINATSNSDDSTPDIGGLFGSIGKGGVVQNLGLEDVNITVSSTGDNAEDGIQVGALAADNRGTVTGVWSSGSVSGSSQRRASHSWVNVGGLVSRNDKGGSGSDAYEGVIRASYSTTAVTSKASSTIPSINGDARAGGLVAVNKGTIAASYATGNATTDRSSATGNLRRVRTGGLVAINNGGTITASYATGNVWSNAVAAWDGGLVGRNNNGTITASYSTGTVRASGSNKNRGGLVGTNEGSGTVTDSYWDTTTSGRSTSPAGTGKTTSELQTPTAYGTGSSIYANWNVNVDGVTGNDDPWDFGTSSQYPILKYGALQNVTQR